MDSQVAVAFQPAGQGSIAAALERIPRDARTAEKTGAIELPLVCFAELVPLGSLVEPGGRVVLEHRVAVVRPFSLKLCVDIQICSDRSRRIVTPTNSYACVTTGLLRAQICKLVINVPNLIAASEVL